MRSFSPPFTPPLAYSLYSNPHLRSRCDTDLFFPDNTTAEKAWNALEERGYRRPNAISGEYVSHQFSCYKTGPMGVGHTLDIHWQISNRQYLARVLTYQELVSHSQAVPSLGSKARTLGWKHALLLACAHRIAHKPQGMENRLIWLYDIHLIAEKLDLEQWQDFLLTAKKKKLQSACLDGLKQSAAYFHTKIPENIWADLNEVNGTEEFTPHTANSRWKTEFSDLRSLPGWPQRLRLIKEHLLPSAEYMLSKDQTRNPLLLPWLYAKRITQGVIKILRQP